MTSSTFFILVAVWCDSRIIKNPLQCREIMITECHSIFNGFGDKKERIYACLEKAQSVK